MLGEPVKLEVFLDDDPKPITLLRPPGTFELDITKINDGPHRLRLRAVERSGIPGIRVVDFTVCNGPGITVAGIRLGDVVEGKVPVMINAYARGHEGNFGPRRAETPAPVSAWAWVLFLAIVSWATWYAANSWAPSPRFASTLTYGKVVYAQAGPSSEAGAAAPSAQVVALGEQVYGNKCAACHQPDGGGVPGVFPPLKGDPVVLNPDATEQIHIVLRGLHGKEIGGVTYASEMPSFAAQLDDEHVAAVINHTRTSWGNHAPTISPPDVAKVRAEVP